MWNKGYSKLLKQTFNLYNINNAEIAEEIGVSEATIRQWQTGRNFPSKAVLDNLYMVLEKTIREKTNKSLDLQLSRIISDTMNLLGGIVNVGTENVDTVDLLLNQMKVCYANGKNCPLNMPSKSYLATGNIQVIVFDFDGTLTASKTTKTTWEAIWTELGYNVEECRNLHRDYDLKKITHEQWCKQTEKKFVSKNLHRDLLCNLSRNIKLINGCAETFDELFSRNIKIHIVSGSILSIIQEVLKDLYWHIDSVKANDFKFSHDGFLTNIIGTKYDFEGKADYISEIAEGLKISTSDILFIGNSYNDKYAHISGAKTLCINPQNTDPSDNIVWHNCIYECTDLTQILSYI